MTAWRHRKCEDCSAIFAFAVKRETPNNAKTAWKCAACRNAPPPDPADYETVRKVAGHPPRSAFRRSPVKR